MPSSSKEFMETLIIGIIFIACGIFFTVLGVRVIDDNFILAVMGMPFVMFGAAMIWRAKKQRFNRVEQTNEGAYKRANKVVTLAHSNLTVSKEVIIQIIGVVVMLLLFLLGMCVMTVHGVNIPIVVVVMFASIIATIFVTQNVATKCRESKKVTTNKLVESAAHEIFKTTHVEVFNMSQPILPYLSKYDVVPSGEEVHYIEALDDDKVFIEYGIRRNPMIYGVILIKHVQEKVACPVIIATSLQDENKDDSFLHVEKAYKHVDVEDVLFNRNFEVFSNDEEEAFKAVTPARFSKFLKYKADYGHFVILLIDSRIYVMMYINQSPTQMYANYKKLKAYKELESKLYEEVQTIAESW